MVSCMLQNRELSNQYWDDATRTSMYIINRIRTSSLDGVTPYEEWYLKKPNVRHFKVFGCLAYVHVPNKNIKKLDAKSESCIFIGYSESSKAYRLYYRKTRKIIISRDVIFDEWGAWSHKKLYVGDPPYDVNATNMHPKNQSKINPPNPPSPTKTSNDGTSSSSISTPSPTPTSMDEETPSVMSKRRKTLADA